MPTFNVTDPQSGVTLRLTGDSPPTEAELEEIFAQQAQPAPQPAQEAEPAALGGGRSGRGQRIRQERERTQNLLSQFEAGQITSQDLTDREVEEVRKARIEAIPELTGSFERLSDNLGFTQAIAGLTAFDPDEFGNILQQADPNIGVVTTPEGERIAINRQTNEAFSINKLGPSLIDAVQLGGAVAALTPAGAARTVLGRGAAAGATQAGIEAGQAATGGEFDPEAVAIAGVAGPALEKTLQGAKSALTGLQTVARTARPTEPGLEAAEQVAPRSWISFGQESPTKTAIREAIEKGEGENVTARYIIDGANKVKADPVARESIKQGFDEGLVAAVKGSTNTDKAAMKRMINIVEKGRGNRLFASKNRPSDVVGESLLKRWKTVRDFNVKAGKQLDGVARDLKGQPVDTSNAVGSFLDDLDSIGVTLGDDFKPSFVGSNIEGIPAAENLINKVVARLKKASESGDAFEAHRMKKFIDEQVSFGKVGEGLTGRTEGIVKGLRRNIDQSLDDTFPEYNRVNTEFSDTIQALDDFQSAAGSNFDPLSPNAEKFVGTLSRRLLSNIQSRVKLMDSIAGLESAGKKLGAKFDDDVFTQAMFVDDLEKIFGSFAPTSLQGVTEKAILQGAQTVRGGIGEAAIGLAAKGAERARGINEANAIKSIRALVGRQ